MSNEQMTKGGISMKIVMLTPYYYPHTGGTEKYVKDLSIGLVQAGHEVTVISNNVPIRKHAPAEEVVQGVKIIRLPAFDTLYLPVTWAFNLKLVEGYDIVHVHVPAYSFLRAVGRKVKAPVVTTFHCDIVSFDKFMGIPLPKFFLKAFEWVFDVFYARRHLPFANAIISTTESYARTSFVLKDFPHKVIPIGIHYENFDEKIKELGLAEKRKKNTILFLGRLAANKGVHYLVEAMPKILSEVPDAKLIICGEGEEKAHLLALIRKFGIKNSVEFYGVVTFDKLVEFYATSTVFVLPSINRLEAFGIVQLEAMACRTPVVASNIPGVCSVMEEGKSGLLAEPRNPDSLAEQILKILKDPEMARRMGERGRQLIEEKYNWPVIVDQVLKVYKEALARKRGG